MATETTDQASEGTARPRTDQLRDDALRSLYQRIIDIDGGYLHDLAPLADAIKAVSES